LGIPVWRHAAKVQQLVGPLRFAPPGNAAGNNATEVPLKYRAPDGFIRGVPACLSSRYVISVMTCSGPHSTSVGKTIEINIFMTEQGGQLNKQLRSYVKQAGKRTVELLGIETAFYQTLGLCATLVAISSVEHCTIFGRDRVENGKRSSLLGLGYGKKVKKIKK